MPRRILPKFTPLQEQCHAFSIAIRKGSIVQANIQGTMRKLLSIKNDSTTGTTLLFHDEQENLCMFKIAPGTKKIELVVSIESEARND